MTSILVATLAGWAISLPLRTAPVDVLPIEEAQAQGLVELEVHSISGHSGEVAQMTVSNKTGHTLRLRVTPGLALYPEEESDQTLIIGEQQQLVLRANSSTTTKLLAFCTESADLSPASGSLFTLAPYRSPIGQANPLMDSLMQYVQQHSALLQDHHALQNAVWAVAEGGDISGIYSAGNPAYPPFREQICRWLGTENVWYNTAGVQRLDEYRRVISEPTSINGELRLDLDGTTVLQGMIVNAAGELVWSLSRETRLPAGSHRMRFELTIEGWEPGEYAVVYTDGTRDVMRQVFHIS